MPADVKRAPRLSRPSPWCSSKHAVIAQFEGTTAQTLGFSSVACVRQLYFLRREEDTASYLVLLRFHLRATHVTCPIVSSSLMDVETEIGKEIEMADRSSARL